MNRESAVAHQVTLLLTHENLIGAWHFDRPMSTQNQCRSYPASGLKSCQILRQDKDIYSQLCTIRFKTRDF